VIQILDTTLREGEQTPGVYFDVHIKLAIASLLDRIGIELIEAGHPAVTSEISQAVHLLSHKGFNSTIGAHSRSIKQDIDAALSSGVEFLGIFYCVSNDRLNGVFGKPLHHAIDSIAESIRYAREVKPDLLIRYTPEDTVRSSFENVLHASVAAVQAGADIISVADTTGFMVPGSSNTMFDFISHLQDGLSSKGLSPIIAAHCHNDRGLALANALDAIRAGASIIDVSVLGIGERAGIVDLAQLLISLIEFDKGITRYDLKHIMTLYELVSKYSNIPIPANFPVTGANAFTHCAGVHTHAAIQNPVHYQSVDPNVISRKMQVSLDHMSGISSVNWALEQLEIELDHEIIKRVLVEIKRVGQKGRIVDETELVHIVDWCKHEENTDENRIPAFTDQER